MSARRPRSRLRWFQFGLSALLIFMTLAVAALVAWRLYVAPYERQRQTMLLLEKLGGRYETEAVDKWLGRVYPGGFQNVTLVDLVNCDDPTAYLDEIICLPQLKILAVGGDNFADEHLQRLERLSSLRALVLDSTSTTDDAIAALKKTRPNLDIWQTHGRAWLRYCFKFQPIPSVRFGEKEHVKLPDELLRQFSHRNYHLVFTALDATGKADDASLVDIGRFRMLQELVLDKTQITDAGLEHLTRLPELTKLSLVGTKVTSQGVAKLQRALPKCEIRGVK